MMTRMRARTLLSEIDRLSFRERTRLLTERARRLPAAELDELLGELTRGDTFQRLTAVAMAEAGRRDAVVAGLLADPEPRVRSRALAAVANGVRVPDETLVALYEDAPAVLRKQLVRTVRTNRRTALAVRLVDRHRERWGDRAAARLLPACDDQTVARLLPELGYCLGAGDWERLGARFPDLVLRHAEDALTGLDDAAGRQNWWNDRGWGVIGAIEHRPEQVLALAARALPPAALPSPLVRVLGRLIDVDPRAVLRILLEPDRREAVRRSAFTPAVKRRLGRFTDDELVALGRIAWATPAAMAALLDAIPPARRQPVFAGVTARLDLSQAVLDDVLLDVLPHAERHRQAARMLGLDRVRQLTYLGWRIAAHLPFDEALALLEPEARRPEAEERGAVHRSVIGAAARSRNPETVRRALEWVADRVRNDRDPVRQAALGACAAIPPSVLDDRHVPVLDVLRTDALQARDSSWHSQNALRTIAESAVREGAVRDRPALLAWGLRTTDELAGRAGSVGLTGILDGLPRGRETDVYEALRPHVDAAAKRKEYALAFQIADSFGKRGWRLEHLYDVLERAVWSNQEYTVGTAVRLWLTPPATRDRRTERIVSRDPGMVRWDAAWYAVTTYRTDLLDKVLAKPAKTRRFDRDHPNWYVRPDALRRWLPRQHARYADLLADVARDTRIPAATRAAAVNSIGRVPGADPEVLRRFAADPDVLIAEAALAGLAWTDRPDLVIPTLLAHAGDDRARVATYALTRAARFVRPSELTTMLRPMLLGEDVKVTSRKEAARLLGELRAPGAVGTLAEAWPEAHRDVRAAITSAVAQFLLFDESAWSLLDDAAAGPPATAGVIARTLPVTVAERYRPRFGRLVARVCDHPDPDIARSAYAGLARWGRWVPDAAERCARALTDPVSPPQHWQAAASSLVALVPLGAGPVCAEAAATLAAADEHPTHDAGADYDRPARRRLAQLVDALTRTVAREQLSVRRGLRDTAAALAAHPSFVREQLRLLTVAARWDSGEPGLEEDLRELVGLTAARPLLTAELCTLVGARLDAEQSRWRSADLAGIADRIAELGPAGALLAVTLTGHAGARLNWPPGWRERVTRLRTHPDPDVRLAALTIDTAQN